MATYTSTISDLEQYLERGHGLVRKISQVAGDQMPARRFKGNELAELAGVSLSSIYKAEKEGRLPSPELDPENHRRLGATLEQAIAMQQYFNTRPCRRDNESAAIMSFTNFKGGCWKTTTSWYAGSYYANLGYRVLFVDLDPQASLTHNCGILPDFETSHEDSLGPYILEDDGFPSENAKNAIRDTYLPNLKIIPSTLELAGVEYALSSAIMEARRSEEPVREALYWFNRVRDVIDHVKQDFDIVIMDGTPSLGLLPMNIIFGSDTVIVPVPTEITDFASTLAFGDLYRDQVETLHEFVSEELELPEMLFLPTRFSASEKNATLGSEFVLKQIRASFGSSCMQSVIKKHEAVVSNLTLMRRTIFDVSSGDANVNSGARKRAMANFQTVFDEILERAVFPRWESKRLALEEKGIY